MSTITNFFTDLFTPPPARPNHDGFCGFCKTSVPIEASVCTGCGARWGLYNEEFGVAKRYKLGKLLVIVGSILTPFLWIPIIFVFQGFWFMKKAREAQYNWWRSH